MPLQRDSLDAVATLWKHRKRSAKSPVYLTKPRIERSSPGQWESDPVSGFPAVFYRIVVRRKPRLTPASTSSAERICVLPRLAQSAVNKAANLLLDLIDVLHCLAPLRPTSSPATMFVSGDSRNPNRSHKRALVDLLPGNSVGGAGCTICDCGVEGCQNQYPPTDAVPPPIGENLSNSKTVERPKK